MVKNSLANARDIRCSLDPWIDKISWAGDPAKRLRTLREFDFGGRWDLIIELPQDWGNRLLEGTNKPVGTRTQEKEAVNPHETEQDLPLSKNLQWRPGLTVACHRVGALNPTVLGATACWHKSI